MGNWRVGLGVNVKKINEQVQNYLDYSEKERNLTAQTMRSKRYILNKFTNEVGIQDLKKLTDEQVRQWIRLQVDKGVSANTINTRLYHLIALLKFLKNKQKLKLKIRIEAIEMLSTEERETTYISFEEVKRMKEVCVGIRDLLLISLMYESGLRITETATLKIENISGTAIKVYGKGRKWRTTFMLEETRSLLNQWIALNGITAGYVFPSPLRFGEAMSTDQVRYVLKSVFRRADVQKRPHDLRHGTATHLITGGAPLSSVQAILGHTDPKVTSRYIHLVTSHLQKVHTQFMTK